jgi:hypothetical protein
MLICSNKKKKKELLNDWLAGLIKDQEDGLVYKDGTG